MFRNINNYEHINRIAVMIMIVIAAVFLNSGRVSAADVSQDAFEIEKYEQTTTINKDHSYDVNKTLTVNVPEKMKAMKLVLSSGGSIIRNINAGELAYATSSENGTQYITITQPEVLEAGRHKITMSYKIVEFAERNPNKDTLYFNALLPEWRQPLGAVDITVNVPDDFVWSDIQYYAGQFGISDDGSKVNFDVSEKNGTIHITGDRIPANFGITLMGDLPDGYWTDPLDGIVFIYIGAGILGLMVLVCFIMWIIGGRDPKMSRPKQTRPIDGISPAELGYIFDGKVKNKDIIALLLYLATSGYIRISEYAPRKYRLYRLAEPKNEEKYIRTAFNILFEGVYEERSIDLDDAWPRLARIMKVIKIDIESGFSSSDMLAQKPISRVFRVISGIIATAAVAIISQLQYAYQYIDLSYASAAISAVLSAAILVGVCVIYDKADFDNNRKHRALFTIVSILYAAVPGYHLLYLGRISKAHMLCAAMLLIMVVMMILVTLMISRGKGNAKLVARYRALRRFVYKPDPKTVAENQKSDPQYCYKMVPYSYLFHGLEVWAKTFRWMDLPELEWYSDDIEGHAITHGAHKQTTIDVAKSMKSFCRTLEIGLDSMHRIHLHK